MDTGGHPFLRSWEVAANEALLLISSISLREQNKVPRFHLRARCYREMGIVLLLLLVPSRVGFCFGLGWALPSRVSGVRIVGFWYPLYRSSRKGIITRYGKAGTVLIVRNLSLASDMLAGVLHPLVDTELASSSRVSGELADSR